MRANFELGLARTDLGEHQKAISSFEGNNDTSVSAGFLSFNIGHCLQQLGKYEQAIEAFEEAKSHGMEAKMCNERRFDVVNAKVTKSSAGRLCGWVEGLL